MGASVFATAELHNPATGHSRWQLFAQTGSGWSNLGPDGKLAITFPMGDKKLPGIAAEDIGKCIYGIFKKGSLKWNAYA